MDKNNDFNNLNNFGNFPPYYNYMGFDNIENNPYSDNPMFNIMAQYEQGYMYYRYLNEQLNYKIKCKEYEKLCENKQERRIS